MELLELLDTSGDLAFHLIVCVACYCVFDLHRSEKHIEEMIERICSPDDELGDVAKRHDRD